MFFDVSDISANVSSFFSCSGNVFINKFSIPASENRFSVYLKQYSFICTFFFSASGNPNIFQRKSLLLLVETDFLASGNHFPFSDTPTTDSFILPSNGNVFVNKFCILVSQSGFSG